MAIRRTTQQVIAVERIYLRAQLPSTCLIVLSLRIPRSSSEPDGKLSRPDLASRLSNESLSFFSRRSFLPFFLFPPFPPFSSRPFFPFISSSVILPFPLFLSPHRVSFCTPALFRVYSSGLSLQLIRIHLIACIVTVGRPIVVIYVCNSFEFGISSDFDTLGMVRSWDLMRMM